jgi:hypothetical protein
MEYNTIRAIFNERVQTKTATLADFVINAIAKAHRTAESEGEANYLTTKAVLAMAVPATNKNKLSQNYNNDPFFKLHSVLHLLSRKVLPRHWKDLTSEDQNVIFHSAQRLRDATQRHYLYIFVRQDMCAEQVTVQTAHATFAAGHHISRDVEGNSKRVRPFDPSSTHFVLIGVPDLVDLYHARGIAEVAGITTHAFEEEDMNGEMTAFTTGIVTQEKRHVFKQFQLLKHRN